MIDNLLLSFVIVMFISVVVLELTTEVARHSIWYKGIQKKFNIDVKLYTVTICSGVTGVFVLLVKILFLGRI